MNEIATKIRFWIVCEMNRTTAGGECLWRLQADFLSNLLFLLLYVCDFYVVKGEQWDWGVGVAEKVFSLCQQKCVFSSLLPTMLAV